jgi:hypothetical protein
MKHFYSKLVNDEALLLELEGLELEPEEKDEMQKMIASHLHHSILEAILDELSEEDKQVFLQHMAHENHDKVWEHLRGKIENIEEKIKRTADSTMDVLYKDIKEVKEEALEV